MNLVEEILEKAKSYPERTAFEEKDKAYSYRELYCAVNELSKLITDRLVSKTFTDQETQLKEPLLIFGKNNFLTLAAMLATNLLGHPYIPVDAHTPFERTAMIYTAANPLLTISSVELEAEFTALFHDTLVVEDLDWQSFTDKNVLPPLDYSHAVSGEESAYLIYTSGTTGIPKGVEVSHNNLKSFTQWMNTAFLTLDKNRILSQALYSFDLSIFSIYPSLTTGGTLVSISRAETINFKHLFERLNSTVINTWVSTPSFLDICLLEPSFQEATHPELKQFIFCGEELTVKTAHKLLTAFPSASIFNTYGPTEATGAVTSIKITPELLKKYERLPIGYAKPGVEIKIIDNEIIIVGNSVAKGYYKNLEKTNISFFSIAGQPAYHTGDAGYLDENGLLHYQGRIDFQVKFNGYRIELQDIESNLQKSASVEKAVVLPKTNDQHKVTALVAFIQTNQKFVDKASERAFTKQVKASLSQSIMDYMMPTKFVYLTDIPLTQNGKVDRKALAEKV